MLNAILVGLATFTLLGLTGVLFLPKFIRHQLEQQLKQATSRLFTESYTKNIFEGVTALRKFGIQWAVENELRSHHPAALLKPIGTHRPFPHFDGLLFSSAQLHRRALNDSEPVTVTTVIGKRADRPMTISLPVMTSAMGYGVALNKPFARAIAKGTALAGTAFNTGQGPALREFRELAHRLVVQYHGAAWRPPDEILSVADMIEIRYGQGANAGCGTAISGDSVNPEIAEDMGGSQSQTKPGEFYIPAGIPGIHTNDELKQLVKDLREISRGAPIAIKMAAGNDLEADLALAVQADADVVVLDGAQGGTFSSPAILVDDFGIPTLAALCRAVRFLRENGLRDRVDLVISGGIRTPGDMLKALALGADAMYIGTAALFATMHAQITKAVPFDPPTQLAWATGQLYPLFNEDEGAGSLANFFTSCSEELKMGARALGKTSIHDVCAEDLVAWDPEVERITGVPLT
ncbi:MAG: FMN-binding glutamate synthase family protein [Sulfobacillus sp.]